MSDQDKRKYTLWWVSSDNQASIYAGNYDSEKDALNAIPSVESEFREECSSDSPYDEDSKWVIEPPDSEYE